MSPLARLLLAVAALGSVAADRPSCTRGEAPEYEAPSVHVLAFVAEWCAPCQNMEPVLTRLRDEGVLQLVDVDRERELTKRHGVSGIPSFVAIRDGEVLDRLTGVQSESRLRRWAGSCSVVRHSVSDVRLGETDHVARVTYALPEDRATALVAFLKEHSEVEFDAEVDGDVLRVTAVPEVQRALGPFLKSMLAAGKE